MEGKPPLLSDFPYLDYSMSPTIRQYLSFSFLITQLNSDKLNIAKVYKQLWYGDGWTSGTLTVPDFSQYNLFLIGFSHVPIPMIGFKFLNTLYAYGVDLNAQYGQRIYCAQCNYSGNVLSNLKTSNVLYYYGGDVGNKETFPITHVFGIV